MTRKIKSTTHGDRLLTGVAKLLTDTTHKHSDLQLKVGGKTFHCHRLILALKSPYFEQKLFPSPSAPPPSPAVAGTANQPLVLNGIGANDFHKVLEFVYTGETAIDDENVESIARAADLLKLPELRKFCVDYLTERVTADTCPRYWSVAEQMNLATLAATCKHLCLKEFEKVASFSELGSLSEKMMVELLEDDGLAADSEVDVCEMLLNWLKSQAQSGNSVQSQRLLTLIRWSGVPVEYVKLVAHSILMADGPCFEFLSQVVSYRLTGVQFDDLNTSHRSSTEVEQCAVVVGLNDGSRVTSDVYRVSLSKKDLVTDMQPIPTALKPETVACVSGRELYVTGAGAEKVETWKWQAMGGWMRCADMLECRRRHCATFVDDNTSMYVLGGFGDGGAGTLSGVEQYDAASDRWTKAGQLMHATSGAPCAVHRALIYVFGGFGHNNVNIDCIQAFDTATNLCTELTRRLPHSERLLRAVSWDRSVILVNNRSCLVFDLDRETFQQRDQFAVGVGHFGLVLENQRIYIIGGADSQTDEAGKSTWTCSDAVKSIAVTDIVSNRTAPNWIDHAKLPSPCLIQAYALMTLPTVLDRV